MAPRITLTTDFGTRDSYVAQLKGVLLTEFSSCAARTAPSHTLQILDLSHDLEPFDVPAAAWFLRAAIPRFPPGTVHLVIVDPGVGSARRALVARVAGQILVGPDNGSFGYLFGGTEEVFVVDPAAVTSGLSSTFHGRDLFAPLAARLAAGARCEDLGVRVDDHLRMSLSAPVAVDGGLAGQIVHVDRYGNLITNLMREAVERLGAHDALRFQFQGHEIAGLRDHYAQVEPGEPLALVGSEGLVELSLREGSAALRYAAARGVEVRVSVRPDEPSRRSVTKRS